jgi:polyferredoxin
VNECRSQRRLAGPHRGPIGSVRERLVAKVYTLFENLFRGPRSVQPARNRSIVRSALTLPRLRRLSQTLFLGLFLVLLCKTEFRGSFQPSEIEFRLPYPVRAFLETDPLVAIANALATHALYRGLLWSLAILIPTLFLGRFFCGWICPLGTMNHLVANIRSEKKSGRQRIASNRYKQWQTFKYYLLIALLLAAFLGGALVGILDPIALAVRSLALSILPAWNYALNALLERSHGHSVLPIALLSFKQAHFRQGFLLGVIFIVILALNLRITRLWCRALCPLGALLGLASRWSILGLEKHPAHCEDCNRCLLHCQGGDDPIPGVPWRKAECVLCMNCVADCPESGIQFRFFPPAPSPRTIEGVDLKRRKVLAGLAAGAATLPLLRANTGLSAEPHERLIRPPAALDEKQFLARCIRCGECMKVCPNNALHPALTEAGWEGIWTPVLAPRVGYCEPSCTLCGQVCPTGAIWRFTSKEKAWALAGADTRPIRLGTAFYDRGRCLPWAMATDCIVCEEWCPTSPKAVYLQSAEVTDAAGNTKQVRQPYIDPEHCVGCGACEFACPVRDRPAVYVTSAGESRSKTNQILIGRANKPMSWFPESGDVPGWMKVGETRLFEAVDLWKYVDGDAERYLRAGVRRTLTANYRYGDAVEAVADIYLMEAPRGAASIFESEPSSGSRPVALGDAGRSYGQSLTFRQGPFFVRLVAYEDAPQTARALVSLAQAIAARLVGAG